METKMGHAIKFADWIKRQPLLIAHVTAQNTQWMSSLVGVTKVYTSEELYEKFINYESL
jgi:YHS domain-containing protein